MTMTMTADQRLTSSVANNRHRSLGATYLSVIFVWNPLIAAIVSFVLAGPTGFARGFSISLLISTIVSSFCFAVVVLTRLGERWWASRRQRVAPTRSVSSTMALAGLALPIGLYLAFQATGPLLSLAGITWHKPEFSDYRFGLFLGFLIVGLFFLWRTRADAQDTARGIALRLKDAEKQQLQAQVSALTAQMNPHLLFNALNTVAELVHSDPTKAEEVLVQLSQLYRGVLVSAKRSLHSLKDELQLCEAYLKVEQARFGARLVTTIDVQANINTERLDIPVLMLQPLVENAVKHGLADKISGGTVAIKVRAATRILTLSVQDNGVGFGNSIRAGAGMGIETCRERLNLCYGDLATLSISPRPDGGTIVVINLPLDAIGTGLE